MKIKSWQECFSQVPGLSWQENGSVVYDTSLNTVERLKRFLDLMQVRYCLVRPFMTMDDYPLVEIRELLPSFESDLYEYTNLPGFSMVAFARSLNYFNEPFQFDLLHSPAERDSAESWSCPLEKQICSQNMQTIQSRLPRVLHENFRQSFARDDVIRLENYPRMLPFLLELDRGHVFSLDSLCQFYLSGIYASFPSDLNRELKHFGLRINKFRRDDNNAYEQNRNFVYQFFMELHGFPVASERRTSAVLFARKLQKKGERFLVRALGQTDRTITSLYSPYNLRYLRLEKIALVKVDTVSRDIDTFLTENGFYVSNEKKAIILRFAYRQHAYDPNNIRQDRALSILRQEIVHPLTGEICSEFNVARDMYSMSLKLNDIVRGEFIGRVRYKRNEIVENTDSHEKRLKFLYAWLGKNQRRIIAYSDEFYNDVHKVVDNYLFDPDLEKEFSRHKELYQEVRSSFSFIQQARNIKVLEDLSEREYKGERISYSDALEKVNEILSNLKFEVVNYFPEIVSRILYLTEKMLNNPYLVKNYITPKESDLTRYGLQTKKRYRRLVALMDEFQAIRKHKSYEEG